MKYKFNEEQQAEIKAARKVNRDKQIDKRLEVLELRCKGVSQKEVSIIVLEMHRYTSFLRDMVGVK